MKTKISGVQYDTKRDEVIANHDTPDNRRSLYLHITEGGQYYLRTDKLQVRKNGAWRDVPMDGSVKGVGLENLRHAEEIRPLSEERAIDWCVATLLPPCIGGVIQERLGPVISIAGRLAEPLQRYCEAEGITLSEGLGRAVMDGIGGDEIALAISLLQSKMAATFGEEVNTETGAATLTIAHDRIELTGCDHERLSDRTEAVVKQLRSRAAVLS